MQVLISFFSQCFWQDFDHAGVELNWEVVMHGVGFGRGNTGVWWYASTFLLPPFAHYSKQNKATENASLFGTHANGSSAGARALHGGSSCGRSCAWQECPVLPLQTTATDCPSWAGHKDTNLEGAALAHMWQEISQLCKLCRPAYFSLFKIYLISSQSTSKWTFPLPILHCRVDSHHPRSSMTPLRAPLFLTQLGWRVCVFCWLSSEDSFQSKLLKSALSALPFQHICYSDFVCALTCSDSDVQNKVCLINFVSFC